MFIKPDNLEEIRNEYYNKLINKEINCSDIPLYVLRDVFDYDTYLDLINKMAIRLYIVNKEYRDRDMCFAAVMNNPDDIIYVPERDKTFNEEEFFNLCSEHPEIIMYVPDKYMTFRICKVVAEQTDEYNHLIPKEYDLSVEDPDIIKRMEKKKFHKNNSIKKKPSFVDYIEMFDKGEIELYEIPYKYRVRLAQKALKKDGMNIAWLKESDLNYELCKIACSNAGQALAFVPEKYRDKEMCKIAKDNDIMSVRFFPESIDVYEILTIEEIKYLKNYYENVIKNIKERLDEFPAFLKTLNFMHNYVKKNPKFIKCAPSNVVEDLVLTFLAEDRKTLFEILKVNQEYFKYIPESLLNDILIEFASFKPANAEYIPESLRNRIWFDKT